MACHCGYAADPTRQLPHKACRVPSKTTLGDRAMMWDFNSCDGVLGYNQRTWSTMVSYQDKRSNIVHEEDLSQYFSLQVKLETEWNASTCGGFHHWRYPFIAAWFIFWNILRWMMTGGTLWLRKAPISWHRTKVCGICGTFGLNTYRQSETSDQCRDTLEIRVPNETTSRTPWGQSNSSNSCKL